MRKEERSHLEKLNEKRKSRRKLHILGGLCGILVTAGVFGALTLPGLGLDGANQTLICMQEEHTHDASCGGAEICSLEEHVHSDSCYVTAVTSDGEEDEGTINQGLVVNLSPDKSEGLTGELLSVTVNSSYSKANTENQKATVRLSMGVLPEGVTVVGFDEITKQLKVILKNTQQEEAQYVILELSTDEETGETYIQYELPEGAIVDFKVQLVAQNGVLPKKTDVTVNVKDYVVPEGTNVTVPGEDKGVTLTWTADHEWNDVDKTVSAETIKVNTENKIAGQLIYTITAESSNREVYGEIWTTSLKVKDSLTLPDNISLPEGFYIKDNEIVTEDGETILSFTDLQGGTVEKLSVSGKTISYELSIPNSHMVDGVPTQEQDNLKIEMLLHTTYLVLPDGYRDYDQNVIETDLITNQVELTSVPYQEYPVTPSTDEVTTKPTILEEQYNFWKSSNGSNFGARCSIMYTLRIINTGETSLAVTDEEGKPYLVTDILPECVEMTDAQVADAQTACAKDGMSFSYDKESNTVTWNLGTQSIEVGSEAGLNFWVTVKEAKIMNDLGYKDGDRITNIAEWRKKPSSPNWVAYKTAKLDIEKTVADASKDSKAQNGEELTYTISVRNDTNYESIIDEVIKDTLPSGLTFKSMTIKKVVVTDTGEVLEDVDTLSGSLDSFDLHGATEGCGQSHKGSFTVNGQELSWKIGCLQANEKVVFTYNCTVDTDALEDKTTISNTAEITDDSSTATIGVDYPLTIDKQVTGITKITEDGKKETLDTVDLTKAYENKTVFDYKITVANAEDPYSSQKDTMTVEDILPTNMFPYECELFQVDSDGTEVNANTLLGSNGETVSNSYVWTSFINAKFYTTDTTKSYYTVINGEKVQVEHVAVTEQNNKFKIKLIWTLPTPSAGKSYDISYRAQILLTDPLFLTAFKNIATVDNGPEKVVTVYGGRSLGNIKLTKQFYLYDNNKGEKELVALDQEDERWKNIRFELTGKDPDENTIVFGYDEETNDPITSKILTMDDLTESASGTASCYNYRFYNVPIGTYTLKEIGYQDSFYQISQVQLGKACNNTQYEWEKVGVNEITFDVVINGWSYVECVNSYYTKDTVNLQKSVYAIVEEDENGKWTSLHDKYLFSLDKESAAKKYVIYDVTVSALGGKYVTIESLTDQLPDGLKFVGVCAKSDYVDATSFSTDVTLSTEENNLLDQSYLNQEGVKLRDAVRITNVTSDDDNKVSFVFDFGSDTNTSVSPNTYNLYGGQAFTFLMLCEVNEEELTAGQELTNTVELKVSSANGLSDSPEYIMVNTPCDSIQNNGDVKVITEPTTENGGTMVIQSSVTVVPENTCVPGIEKNATHYIETGTKIEKVLGETTNIPSNSAVKWEVILHNDGTQTMTSYKVADEVTSPFHLMTAAEATKFGVSAPISFQLYDYNGNAVEGKYFTDIVSTTVSSDSSSNSYEFDLLDEKYEIPSGYYAILTVYTNNVDVCNQVYKNTATLLPTQTFVANRVRYGELTTDSNGSYNGVMASDYVYALGKYASISWKTIEEKGNSSNAAKGNSSKNYITVDRDSDYVIYTNNIQNISENNFNQLVVVDLMPMVNDTGVVNRNDKRGSEFSVLFNGGLKIEVLDPQGNVSRTLEQNTDYTLEFSTKTGFTVGDFAGDTSASWHSEWTQDDRSFRIVLNDEFYLNPQYTLVITYEGEIDSAATPGTIAWNSFGYQYCASGLETPVRAEPPKVGVMIPAVPIIQKEVIDSYGDVQERDAEKEFTFALWDGDLYETDPDNAKICEFTVCQGGYKELADLKDIEGNEVNLVNGKVYVITELTGADYMPEEYEMIGIGEKGGTLGESYTFTYHNNKNIRILARNQIDKYRSELPSTGGIGTRGFTMAGIVIMSLAVLLYGCRIVIVKKKERQR